MATLIDTTSPQDARGHEPEPDEMPRSSRAGLVVGRVVTGLLVIAPAVALAIAVPLLWGRAVTLRDVILAGAFYTVTTLGVTVGYHRLFTHRSFRARRWLRIVLASAGSLAVEGSVVGWVAAHRKHHVFSDKPGDPHSPHGSGSGIAGQLRGFVHAHVGWLFKGDATSAERYAPDLLRDTDTKIISRLFPFFAFVSLAAPFFLGWTLSGALSGAFTALLWAGLARMMLLHHVTWSVNSICHMFGRQPATQKDESRNFAPLALLSFGESWHNMHHAYPCSARHGALPHQIDLSAGVIRLFERAGWVTNVKWPTPAQVARCQST
ncbi:MAG TPA: acyl-CoA desaturase [Acidimicrobiia bacterium]|nr:acyl-CoA desaturase [Acidimicrobiia bacterium]